MSVISIYGNDKGKEHGTNKTSDFIAQYRPVLNQWSWFKIMINQILFIQK